MKFVLFDRGGARATYGVLNGDTIKPLNDDLIGDTPQEMLRHLIESVGTVRPRLDAGIPLAEVRLLPPVPWPGKIVVTTATYGASAQKQQLLATLKSAESVIGPEGTVHLPAVDSTWQFVPQAMLGLVIRGPAKNVSANAWQQAVFGYTCVIDVMGISQPSGQQFGRDFWFAKADTLGPLGPCIVTSDEIPDPASLVVRSSQNGVAAQNYGIGQGSHTIAEQVEFVTTVMTVNSGDVVACGTSPDGQRALADGDRVEVDIDAIGRLAVNAAAMVGSAA